MEKEHHPSYSIRSGKQSKLQAWQLLRESKTDIKAEWEKRVRKQTPGIKGTTSLVLQNSLDIFLDELTGVLRQDSYSPTSIEAGMAKIHGQHRAAIVGYILPQLLTEFSILRQIITEKLHKHDMLTFETRTLIDKSIDSAISLAATEFVSVQQKKIKVALVRAEISNRDLEQFAGIAAHDLKSPLATISGYLDLLEGELNKIPTAPGIEYVKIMQKASGRMLSLIDRLLEYAQLTETPRPFQSVNLNEVVKNTLENLSETIKNTGTKITYEELPTVMGDMNLLSQVFQNLFANSIKFGGLKSPLIQVNVDANKIPGFYLFRVTDNGIGLDSKDVENIFALYKSLHTENKYQGAGIGLATCRKVIELHGGRIWAESELGKGSKFFFTLSKS